MDVIANTITHLSCQSALNNSFVVFWVCTCLVGYNLHTHPEHPFLSHVYNRHDVKWCTNELATTKSTPGGIGTVAALSLGSNSMSLAWNTASYRTLTHFYKQTDLSCLSKEWNRLIHPDRPPAGHQHKTWHKYNVTQTRRLLFQYNAHTKCTHLLCQSERHNNANNCFPCFHIAEQHNSYNNICQLALLLPPTFDKWPPFTYIVARPEQQTNADELDKPAACMTHRHQTTCCSIPAV